MPGATLPNTGITLPTIGGDAGTWDVEINAALSNYDLHDHSAGKGVAIQPAGINLSGDLTFRGNGATNVGRVALTPVAALTSGATSIFANSADNELYWRTAGGVNVKLTSGSSLNISLVGGIVGDYVSAGAQFAYDAANSRYTAKQGTGTPPWAKIASADVQLFQFNTTGNIFTALRANPAQAGSFTLTLPAALPTPATQHAVSVDNNGNVSFAGPFTIQIPIQAASLNGNALANVSVTTTGTNLTTSVSEAITLNNATVQAGPCFPIELPIGATITGWTVYIQKNSANTTTVSAQLFNFTASTNTMAASDAAVSNSGAADGFHALTATGLSHTIVAGTSWQLEVWRSTGAANTDNVYFAEVTYVP